MACTRPIKVWMKSKTKQKKKLEKNKPLLEDDGRAWLVPLPLFWSYCKNLWKKTLYSHGKSKRKKDLEKEKTRDDFTRILLIRT